MPTDIRSLTTSQLKSVIAIKEKIESLEAELASILGGSAPAPAKRLGRPPKAVKAQKVGKKRGISAAGRAAIVAAQKARWARVKAGEVSKAAPANAPGKRKRKLSPEGRAAIIAAAKARWAKAKAAIT